MTDKKAITNHLLSKGSAFVHFDARAKGVVVPKYLRSRPHVNLQFGLALPIPIPDLRVDEHGISGTLSFNHQPFFCNVPWEAVFGVLDKDDTGNDEAFGMAWEDDMPTEVSSKVQAAKKQAGPELNRIVERKKSAPHLRLVKS